ncbi:MAG: ABC transporter permease [Acidimicrobiia bacterium]|nr:ABC transporter permease [Acidimicrobiia bacterium]MDX2466383.1 ABC transporter permease [Acidimicrobiia bacterium]
MLLMTRRDLLFRSTRFVVVTIGVTVVMALLFLMTGLIEQFNQEPFDTVGAIGAEYWVVPEGVSGPFTASATLSPDTAAAVSAPDAAAVIVARGSMNVGETDSEEVLVIGHEEAQLGIPTPVAGRPATSGAEIVVDRSTGLAIGDDVALGTTQLQVVGLTEDTTVLAGLPVVFLEIDRARLALFDGREVVTGVLSSEAPIALPAGTSVLTADQVAADALGPLENAVSSVDLIRALLWVVTAIIIGAVVYLSALERQRDFAVMKAMGASNSTLVASVAIQAVAIALLAAMLAAVLQGLIRPVFPLRVRVPASAYWQIPLVAVLVAVLAGFGGMRRVTASDPAAAFSGPGA